MAKQVLVVGLGFLGQSLAEHLFKQNVDVIAVDKNQGLIDEIKNRVTLALCFDSTNEQALRTINPESLDVAVVTVGERFEINLLTSVMLKELGVKKVISRGYKPIHKKILLKVGVDSIITPEEIVAHILANDIIEDSSIIESYTKKLSTLK